MTFVLYATTAALAVVGVGRRYSLRDPAVRPRMLRRLNPDNRWWPINWPRPLRVALAIYCVALALAGMTLFMTD